MNVKFTATREARIRTLELAIRRLQQGITKVVLPGTRLSIAAVAREAGVSNATIHNRYPEVAEKIRNLIQCSHVGNTELQDANSKTYAIKLTQARKKIEQLKSDLARSQSINLRLIKENELLRKASIKK